jgi:YidC/Oxa1 family membrane protein insertase
MQQRNFIIFIALSILVLAGWTWLSHRLWPPSTAKTDTKAPAAAKLTPAEKQADAFAQLPALDALPAAIGGGPWAVLATGRGIGVLRNPRPVDLQGIVRRHPEITLPGTLALAAATDTPPLFAALGLMVPDKAVRPAARQVTLGGPGYFIEAGLTTQGAGVSRLTLTEFKQANWLGRPVDDPPNAPLHLIPEDPIRPSYVMYFYPDPDKSPVLGLGEKMWDLDGQKEIENGQEVRFSTHVPGAEHLKITKIYTLAKDAYHIGLTIEIQDERERGAPVGPGFRYQLTGAHGLPIEGEWYTPVFRNAIAGIVDPKNYLWRNVVDSGTISRGEGADRMPSDNLGDNYLQYAGSENQFFAALVVISDKQPPAEQGGTEDRSKILAWARPTQESSQLKGRILGVRGNMLVFRDEGKTGEEHIYHLLPRAAKHLEELGLGDNSKAVLSFYETPEHRRVATWVRRGETIRPEFDDITMRVNSNVIKLGPGEKVAHQFLLYHGPVKTRLLSQLRGEKSVPDQVVDRYAYTLHLQTLTDYPSSGIGKFFNNFHLVDLIILCTRVMHTLLFWLGLVIPNYGVAIILLTVIVRGLMHPISRRQAYFSIKMQELAPEMKQINERYANDPQAKTQAVMELYRRHKVHPLGSCLPLVMQMPIFLGLYFALQESIQFRLAPFLWIRNLAAPDMLIWWGESIPFISDPNSQGGVFYLGPYLNILPIIAVVLMMLQQQMLTAPPTDEQQAAQQTMMKFMTIFFGVLIY